MKRFNECRNGDRVYSRVHGFGRILNSYVKGINVRFDNDHVYSYIKCGRLLSDDVEPLLFYVDGDNKYSEVRPMGTVNASILPVDTLLVIKNRFGRLHFAKVCNKSILCWAYGRSSKIVHSCSDIVNFHEANLGESITIDGVLYPEGTKVVV
jgi:hypothetical protein